MTADELEAGCLALEADGQPASGNALVAFAHARGQRLSKRTALAYLRTRPTPPVQPPAPEVFIRSDENPTAVLAVLEPLREADDDPVYHDASVVDDGTVV